MLFETPYFSLFSSLTITLSLLSAFPATIHADTPAGAETTKVAPETNSNLQVAAAASLAWLHLIDKGDYGDSWNQSSGLLRMTMPKDEWNTTMSSTRKSLGNVISRQVLDQRTAQNPHGLPKGDYMVMFYKTSFAHKASAYELVTLFSEDGDWRVVTYQVD